MTKEIQCLYQTKVLLMPFPFLSPAFIAMIFVSILKLNLNGRKSPLNDLWEIV